MPMRRLRFTLRHALFAIFVALGVTAASAQGPTTESICNFGMAKNESKQSCRVPILGGCVVAHFPGTEKPWTNISKGGATQCRFDEKETDWKTKITGTCTRCKTEHCSARFSVMFSCDVTPPAAPAHPTPPPPVSR